MASVVEEWMETNADEWTRDDSFRNASAKRASRCRGTILLALFAAIASLTPGAVSYLEFDRAAIAAGEIWRVITGHFVHWNLDHLLWDLAVFAVLGGMCEWRDRRKYLFVLVCAMFAISGCVWTFQPEFTSYRGLSGLDSALFALLACEFLADEFRARRWWSAGGIGLLLVALVAKIVFEIVTGTTLFVDSQAAGFTPLPLVHLVGAVVGGVAASFHNNSSIIPQSSARSISS